MKYKVISAHYDEETKTSIVTIQNKYGKFTGYAFCHPDDEKDASMYAGSRYAETRAKAAFAKFRYKQEKIKLSTIENLLKNVENNYKYMPTKGIVHDIKIKLRDYSQSVADWENLYKYLEQSVYDSDKERQKILKRNKKKQNQDK